MYSEMGKPSVKNMQLKREKENSDVSRWKKVSKKGGGQLPSDVRGGIRATALGGAGINGS